MKNYLSIICCLVFALTQFSCVEKHDKKILVFSKTEGFRHESIPAGIAMLKKLGQEHQMTVVATEDADDFNQKNLSQYNVVVFLSTTGDVLNPTQEIEFQRYIQAGGAYYGIHAAADTEYSWPWYGRLVGGYFNGHPNNPNVRDAVVKKTEHKHITTDHIPDEWPRTDEWYNYKNLNPDVIAVLNLDEQTYEGGTNGDFHPIAWYHEFDGGRAYYTGGGHTDESFEDPLFVQHVLAGLEWAIGEGKGPDYTKPTVMPEENRFTKNVLDSYFNEPMELELMPDGRLVFVERKGDIKLYDPKKGKTEVIAHVDVHTVHEDGLMGIALDKNYAANKWIYLCYSDTKESHQNVSRFTFDPDSDNVLSEEKVILKVPTQREECCHSAGSVEMGPDGYLWVSFGDNTNPHQSSGHSPSDEQAGRGPFDAQKSSANMNDLRGKIIRIKVNEDATYYIPDGNLFPKDGSQGRPEIYVMGCRNPFRYSIDPKTKYLYWGEVGPDANKDTEGIGPRGYDEVNQAKKPGFFGWPYFIANNKPYNDYNFATKTSGPLYDPAAPVNDSPNNTGGKMLPPAQPAMVYYPYAESEEFPELGTGGRNAMAGPVYYSEFFKGKPNAFSAYYNGKLFIYDWMRGWIKAVTFDENGDMAYMEPFLPNTKWNNLIDIVLSPDGDFYMLEYGTGWFTANKDARLSHLTFNPGNRKPVSALEVDETAGALPFTVNFDATKTMDSDGDNLKYSWDFGDGSRGEGSKVSHTFTKAGEFMAQLTVTDEKGESSSSQIKILAGNEPPKVDIAITGNSQFYWPGKAVSYQVNASDKEDGTLAPENFNVSVDYLEMGHDITSIAQGHQALSELNRKHPGLELIEGLDCRSCHKLNETSIGPSYEAIAQKYRRGFSAVGRLAEKIINGGSGVWGETAMAAHPDLSVKDATTMAEYIMSLAQQKETTAIPAQGVFAFNPPAGKKPGGQWMMMASYTDQGGEGIGPLRAFKNIVLRSPMVGATEATMLEANTKFTITPQLNPMIKEDMDVVIMMADGIAEYDQFDFTGVGSLTLICNAPAMFAGGGTLDLYIDDATDPATSVALKASMSMDPTMLSVPLKGISGKHKLTIKSKANEGGKPVGILVGIMFNPES